MLGQELPGDRATETSSRRRYTGERIRRRRERGFRGLYTGESERGRKDSETRVSYSTSSQRVNFRDSETGILSVR